MDPEVWELSKSIADAEASDDEPVLFRAGRAAAMRHHTWLQLDERRQQLRDRWAEFFRDHDALLCPVAPTAAFTHKVDDDPMGILNRTEIVAGAEVSHGELTQWCGVIGVVYLPSVVVPVGRTADGLPVGIQVVSGYGQDRTALEVAGRIGDALGGFEPPPGYGG
jgi:amidase